MNDTPVVARPESPLAPGFLLFAGIGLFALGLASPDPWLVFSAFPLIIFPTVLLATRRKGLTFSLTESGIDVLSPPPRFIPYDRLDSLSVDDLVRPEHHRSFEILVHHERGLLVIPANRDTDSSEIYRRLHDRLPPTAKEPVPVSLLEHFEHQLSKFDSGRVFGFRARRHVEPYRSRGLWIALGFILLGFAWGETGRVMHRTVTDLDLDELKEGSAVRILGGLASFGGTVASLILWFGSRGRKRRFTGWQGAGAVMSPIGLALKQGPLEGKLRWEEIEEIRWHKQGDSIRIRIPGSRIVVEDIFDQQIYKLYDLMLTFWRPPAASASDRRVQDDD